MSKEQFRGFAFLTFHASDSIDKVLLKKHHKIKGRKIDVKRAMKKNNNSKKKMNNKQSEQERKIFLFKLKKNLKKSKK